MSGKCAGKRKPPCGRGENCKGFYEGYRCGGHAPVGNCTGHGEDAAMRRRKAAFEKMLEENAATFQRGKHLG